MAHARVRLYLSMVATLMASMIPVARAHPHEVDPMPTQLAEPAPPDDRATQGIYINALQMAVGAAEGIGVIGLGYEHVIFERYSIAVEATYAWDVRNKLISDRAVGIKLHPHIYFLQDAPAGLYLAPFVWPVYGWGSWGHQFGFAGGATVGYSLVLGPINVKVGGGPMYYNVAVGRESTTGALGVTLDGYVGVVF